MRLYGNHLNGTQLATLGDKIRELFDAQGVIINSYDHAAGRFGYALPAVQQGP